VPKNSDNATAKMTNAGLDEPSYRVGVADGRVQAIEESMDAVASLIMRAETMAAALRPDAAAAMRANAEHTVRALHLAFAAVSGAKNGSAAFQSLLAESAARIGSDKETRH
jgi:hypothetical protein